MVPATGRLLVATDAELVALHVTAQFVLLGVIAVHVGLVLEHTLVRRHRHLSRMV